MKKIEVFGYRARREYRGLAAMLRGVNKHLAAYGYRLTGPIEIERIPKMIAKQGSKFVVKSSTGKTLSKPKTKKKAVKQLRAIEANKKKR